MKQNPSHPLHECVSRHDLADARSELKERELLTCGPIRREASLDRKASPQDKGLKEMKHCSATPELLTTRVVAA